MLQRTPRTSIRIDKKRRKQIERWAVNEDITPAELLRRILEWGCDQYGRAGELAALLKMSVGKGKEAA